MIFEVSEGPYLVSTDPQRLDIDQIHAFLTKSYWAKGIAKELVARSLEHSLSFGLYDDDGQAGFARVISDMTTYAYLADVYIEEHHRGKGLSKLLLGAVLSHPDLQGLRRWTLATRDAHELYRQIGFTELLFPERWMERAAHGTYTGEVRG
jgi:GNAT superfamily N-acetyltransferase